MTWQIITANESHCVDLPFEVVPRAHHLLTVNGWTPPPSPVQGLFSCPKEEPMPLTRHEADVVVRELVHQYAKEHGPDNQDPLKQFTLDLSAQIGYRLDAGYLFDVVLASQWLIDIDNGDCSHLEKDDAESALNTSVNDCLDNAGVGTSQPNRIINRFGDQTPMVTHMDFILSTAKAIGVPLTEDQARQYAPGTSA